MHPSLSNRPRLLRILLLLLAGLAAAQVFAGPILSAEERAALAERVLFDAGAANEQFDGFIVYYRNDAAPGDEKSAAARRSRSMLDSDLARVSRSLDVTARHERRLATGGHLIQLTQGKKLAQVDADRFMAELAANPEIASIEPNARAFAHLRPNDSYYHLQWGLFDTSGGINAEPAWDRADGSGVVIAIVDTGITPHPDLDAQLVPGYDFISSAAAARDGNGRDSDPTDEGDWYESGDCSGRESGNSSWHGTHVAGIAAAQANDGAGVAGAAFGARIQPVRVLGRCGGTIADIADGLAWASGVRISGVPANANPARVINMSLGGEGSCGTTYQTAINQARARGAIVIVSAGNDDRSAQDARPANCNGVVTVAAGNRYGRRSTYSNHGERVDLSAPGGDFGEPMVGADGILSAANDGEKSRGAPIHLYMQGTSMAAPFVSGVAALALSRNDSLSPDQLARLLRDTARPFPSRCLKGCGVGIIDANAAVRAAEGEEIRQFPFNVTVIGNGEGTVKSTPDGIDCGIRCALRFNKGRSVKLTATPKTGYRFAGWSGACSGSATTCTLTVDRAHAVYAKFVVPVSRVTSPEVYEGLSSSGVPLMYALTVPSGSTALLFRTSGGSGNVTLYARYGAEPTEDAFDCRPDRNGNGETCLFPAPRAGTWYAMLRADPEFSGIKLEARYTPGPVGGRTLTNAVPFDGVSAQLDGGRYFRILVPASAMRLRFETRGDNGDLDLYLRRGGAGGGVPKLDLFDWVSGEYGSNESIIIDNPVPATYYALLHAYEPYEDVTITARYTNALLDWSGNGAGRVEIKRASGSERAPACTAFPCEASLKNASHDLIAIPAEGSSFAGWDSSQCDRITPQGYCRIRPVQARNVNVNFTRNASDSPVLTVRKTGNGLGAVQVFSATTSQTWGTCENFPCRSGPPDVFIDLIPEPLPGSRFSGWNSGQCENGQQTNCCENIFGNTCRVRLNRAVEVSAGFAPLR